MTLQERIEDAFSRAGEYEQYLLHDVGLVKFHRFGPRPWDNWGLIESMNGTVKFLTKHVCRWKLHEIAKPYAASCGFRLASGQPVTFSQPTHGKRGLKTSKVVIWEPDRFDRLPDEITPMYRFVEKRAVKGGLGDSKIHSETKKLWSGTNIYHAERKMPMDRWPVTDRRWWEVRENGKWKPTTDPRKNLKPSRA